MEKAHLSSVPFFSGLGKKELAAIAQQADELDLPEGKVITQEGDFGHEFFVVEEGAAEVTRGGDKVAELGPGDFFGEIALLEEDRRTATVTATSPMKVVVMNRADFRALDASMPRLHASICAAIEERRAQGAAVG